MWRGEQAPPHWREINLPKATRLVRILDARVRTDEPTGIFQVESDKGCIGVRVAGTTGGVPWSVDLYGGSCYVVQVHGFQSERVDSPLRVLNCLWTKLPCETCSSASDDCS